MAQAADQGPVVIDRRDGDELVLMRRSYADAERLTLSQAATLIATIAEQSSAPLAERIQTRYPWMRFLSDTERRDCLRELLDVAKACGSIGRFEPLVNTLHAWQSTAEAIAAGWDTITCDWLEEPVRVERP